MAHKFSLPEMSKVDFSITYADIAANYPSDPGDSHIHAECEIYVNLSGDVSFEVENRIYPISRGSVIITRPFEYHHCIYHAIGQHKHYWITFSAKEDEDFLKLFFHREKGRNNLIVLNDAQLQELCSVLDTLLQTNVEPLLQRINLLRIFQILNAGTGVAFTSHGSNLPKIVANALLYMDAHFSEEISIDMIAAACNVSQNTLERHFKDAIGASPSATLRKKRLVASLEYLRDGKGIAEAACKCGFSDYSNYIQLFRKQFGLTPLQYKKKFTNPGGYEGLTPRKA